MTKGKHLTLSDRIIIQSGLHQNKSFRQIGFDIDKDSTTVSKEVRNHITRIRSGSVGRIHNSCIHRRLCDEQMVCSKPGCQRAHCSSCSYCNNYCLKYIEDICPALSKPPYVCCGCKTRHKCSLYKHDYIAETAHKQYLEDLSCSRRGCSISQQELDSIDQIISPLLNQGQSLYHIFVNNRDRLMVDSRTLYNYVNNGYLKAKRMDLPRAVTYRVRRTKKELKVDKQCRIGRTDEDFERYLQTYPDTHYVEMDTVIGRQGGKVLLTIVFPQSSFMLAFIRESNDSQSVIDIINRLYANLGHNLFKILFPVILVDNGSEFSNPLALEFTDAQHTIRRTSIFYSRPHMPSDKPHVERNHIELRKVCPKGTSFDEFTQEVINLILSHVNSYSRKKLNGLSPLKSFSHLFGENLHLKFEITEILANEVILDPTLLKL